MKANYKRKDNSKCCYIKVTFEVDSSTIEKAIQELLNEKQYPNRHMVEYQIREMLMLSGRNWYAYWDSDNDPVTESAISLSKQLFPDFYEA